MFGLLEWLSALLIVVLFIRWILGICRLPPGPFGIPLFGYLPWLSQCTHLDFIEIGKEFGGLFSVSLGSETFVVLNDWPTIKATLIEQPKAFSGRRQDIISTTISDNKDVSFCDGLVWRRQRSLAIQAMKYAGMRKKSDESLLLEMINSITDNIDKYLGDGVYLEDVLGKALSDFNWHFISAFQVDDVTQFKKDIDIVQEGLLPSNPIGALPWLRFLPPNGFGFWKYRRSCQSIRRQLRRLIEKHDVDVPPFDANVITHHLQQFLNHPDKNPPHQVDHLLGTIINLIIGSYETTISTVLTGFFHLCQQPKIQEKVRQELDQVVGRHRMPSLSDFPNLLYLEALILEIHRISSTLPLSLPHKVQQTVHINGYEIPKGTTCLQNIYAVHHDPRLWEEPDKFNPDRFIDDENRIRVPPYLMPFSVGSRVCIGQAFADVELRFLFASLLHKYQFSFSKNCPFPQWKAVIALTIKPTPYEVMISRRD